jgi:hypothetical protein
VSKSHTTKLPVLASASKLPPVSGRGRFWSGSNKGATTGSATVANKGAGVTKGGGEISAEFSGVVAENGWEETGWAALAVELTPSPNGNEPGEEGMYVLVVVVA